jgi:hypothetical protein
MAHAGNAKARSARQQRTACNLTAAEQERIGRDADRTLGEGMTVSVGGSGCGRRRRE